MQREAVAHAEPTAFRAHPQWTVEAEQLGAGRFIAHAAFSAGILRAVKAIAGAAIFAGTAVVTVGFRHHFSCEFRSGASSPASGALGFALGSAGVGCFGTADQSSFAKLESLFDGFCNSSTLAGSRDQSIDDNINRVFVVFAECGSFGEIDGFAVDTCAEVTFFHQVVEQIAKLTFLILDDGVKMVWGAEFQSMGMPKAFQMPPLMVGGGVVPVFYLYLMGAAGLIALALWYTLSRTRIGKIVRAAAQNPAMTSALGLNTQWIYAMVFTLGGMLAGLAGGLAAPVRSMSPGMGFSILIESFIVTVIGGMGSVSGALLGALLIGLIRSFGSIGFPLFVEGLMFLSMVLILVFRPSGLMGKGQA